MDVDKKTFWEVIAGPILSTIALAMLFAAANWVVWVSNGVADYEDHDDDFRTLVEKMEQVEDDTSYLRGWVENESTRQE